jgi:thiol-disulfide isomerase/thioredoxin
MDRAWRCVWTAFLLSLGACSAGGGERTAVSASTRTKAPVVVPASSREILGLASGGRARATLVNVWATWCVPCREEFPLLVRLAREYQPRGLELILVSADFDDRLPAVRRFLAAQGVTDTSYLKAEGDQSFIDALSPKWSGALPATFVYDGAGRQIAFWEGKADEARLRKSFEGALVKRSSMEDSSR